MTRRIFLAAGLVLAAGFCGCSQPPDGLNRGGTLSGTVRLDGKPLGGGRVELYSEDGQHTVSCQIGPDGQYRVSEPPLGTCKVVVVTSHLKGMAPTPKPTGKDQKTVGSGGMVYQTDVGYAYTPIPSKYEAPATTDLTVTVQKGDQSQDLTLSGR
jgi:hypothetical protein